MIARILGLAPQGKDEVDAARVRSCERTLAKCGLVASVSIILAKLYSSYGDSIKRAVFEEELVSYEVVTESGQEAVRYAWRQTLRHSSLWLPLVAGFFATYFTWVLVYLDSNVPGVQPPSPLSPRKYKLRSGHTFHLSYLFSVIVGILMATYMYLQGAMLEF